MKKGMMISGVVVAIILGIGVMMGVSLLNQRSTVIVLEESINAQLKANESNYDSMVKKAKEMAQVTDMYAEDFEKIYKGLVEGRYSGEENQKQLNSLFKVVHESNPNLDSTVYTTLQREMNANRTVFDKKQELMVDKIKEYNTYIRKHFIMASILNKQPKNADGFIVTSEGTKDAFKKGTADEINLRGE